MSALFKNIRAVAIDLDGTMIDTIPDLAAAGQRMLESLGLPAIRTDRVAEFVGNGVEVLVRRLLNEVGQDPDPAELASALNQFREQYRSALFVHSVEYPGVTGGLKALRNEGLGLCCVTNKASEFTRPLLQAAGLEGFFDQIYCADHPEQSKPKPWMLEQALGAFGVLPTELLVVGDSGTDIATARAAGCPVAAVDYGYNHGEPIAGANPDWIISSLLDLVDLPYPPAQWQGDLTQSEAHA